MANNTFKRAEVKFLITKEQLYAFIEKTNTILCKDAFYFSTINNIYFDTENDLLIRNSLEKPLYKEKLRLRTYEVPKDDSTAFIEIKKKYDGVVYKRRLGTTYKEAVDYLCKNENLKKDSQVGREIDFFKKRYETLAPAMVISYDRIALKGIEDPEFRVTFDANIRYRTKDLDLTKGRDGEQILKEDQVLMEIKVAGAFPLQMVSILNELNIRRSSFSKYGRAYTRELERSLGRQRVDKVVDNVIAGMGGLAFA
ncbi:MAG: polyphosphate polymerase domain-containing protein [Lachnospiraceae bacterium]|nr:polyphosphate polymerase domain-containing protein [Lachnospiraceae bacterium]